MLFGFAALERTTHHTQTAGASQTPFYPDDLLPELQTTLAILADLEVSFEIARDSLEEWSGAAEDKQRCCAELEQAHRHAREPHLQRLERLQEQIRRMHTPAQEWSGPV
jgi:hypothetical protein